MNKIFEKLQNDFNKGLISKTDFQRKVFELRTKKVTNDRKVLKVDKNLKKHFNVFKIEYIEYPIDNTYLMGLLNDIDFNINNDYIIGLKNLLYDNNYNYNTIGLKVVIAKYLLDIDLKDLKVFEVNNSRLNDDFKFLTFKNSKIKFYTKLYFNEEKGLIIFNTLLHDSISSVVLTINDNIDIMYKDDIEKDFNYNDDNYNDIKNNKYTYVDKDLKVLGFVIDLINVLKLFKPNYKDLTISLSDIDDDNIYKYVHIMNKEHQIYYRYDKLNFKYEYVLKHLKDTDEFKGNDLDNITTIEDYNLYKIDLKDYFIKL